MLQILSAAFGFFAPFLPEVVKLFRERQDNAHELALTELRLKHAAQEHLWRLEEINATADIAEMQTLRQPHPSFGVQLLDAAKDSRMSNWTTLPVFWCFALLDFAAGMVRPAITYGMVGFYMAYKWAWFHQSSAALGDAQHALLSTWTDNDWGVLVLVLSYWFGHRSAKAAFGGSASTGKPGT